MTIYSGVNYSNTQATPFEYIDEGQFSARQYHILDQFVLTADLAANDTILLGGLIPEGATVLDAKLSIPVTLGGSAAANVGWQASPTALTGANTAQAADATAFFNGVALEPAAVKTAHGDATEGDFYTQVPLTAPVQPVLTCTVATSGATAKKIFIDISFTLPL